MILASVVLLGFSSHGLPIDPFGTKGTSPFNRKGRFIAEDGPEPTWMSTERDQIASWSNFLGPNLIDPLTNTISEEGLAVRRRYLNSILEESASLESSVIVGVMQQISDLTISEQLYRGYVNSALSELYGEIDETLYGLTMSKEWMKEFAWVQELDLEEHEILITDTIKNVLEEVLNIKRENATLRFRQEADRHHWESLYEQQRLELDLYYSKMSSDLAFLRNQVNFLTDLAVNEQVLSVK